MQKAKRASGPSAFSRPVQRGDLDTVRKLIASGHKPDAAAARQAADACNKAFRLAHSTTKPLFGGRKPSKKEREKAAVDAEVLFKICRALLKAGAPVPQALDSAALAGNVKMTLLLIAHGADVDIGTPLENAVTRGNIQIIRALIEAGADIHQKGISGTLVTEAVREGHLDALNELIKAGVDVNADAGFGATPLHTAVTERKVEFVKRLLAAGANVNKKDSVTCGEWEWDKAEVTEGSFHVPNPARAFESTPLIVAARRGYADIAALLIQAGPDLEAKDRDGCTAMFYALKAKDEAMSELLAEAGAKAPEYAEGSAEAAFTAAAAAGDCSRLEALLREGLDPNLKHTVIEDMELEEETALRRAAENGRVDAIRLLIKAGARPDETFGYLGDDRQTALMHAALKGQLEAAKVLLEAGANAFARARDGKTVLHYAAEGGVAGIVGMLVKQGVNVESKDKSGWTPLMMAAAGGHLEVVKALLGLGADLNVGSKDGFTPLYLACSDGHTEVARLLLEAGAKLKPLNRNFSPLEAASTEGHNDIVDLLLKAGAGRRKRGEKKGSAREESALVSAALMGKADIVQKLLKNGADPNETDEEHFTALMAAVRSGNPKIVQMLLDAGAEINALNEDRETALDLAYDNIKAAKGQAKFLQFMSGEEVDEETRKAIQLIKRSGKEDELTELLKKAGGKRGNELKGQKTPEESEPEPQEQHEVPIPDFSERAKAPEFQKVIQELSKICGKTPKPVTNEDDVPLTGCVQYQAASEEADRILAEHHEAFLKRGCYLLKSERGYTSGKDTLTLLPTADRNEVLAAFQTNGGNYDLSPDGVIKWLNDMAREQPFLLTGVGFDWCEGRFTTPLKDSKKLAKKMYEFCPDVVNQGVGDVPRLALTLKQTKRFFFWWD